ncbi:MAG: winged helix-turn-helix domain-containing protein [Candidatus Hermodarchaeota archaeon]
MKSTKKNDYKSKILETLDDSPSGLTITDLSEKTGAHRNTVSTHLRSLENENLVSKKEIGSAHLYFSKKREYLSKALVNSFLKALLSSIRNKFPDMEPVCKEVGHEILKKFEFPISDAYIEEFKRARSTNDPIAQLKLFQRFYNSYDFFQDDITISVQELTQKKAVFRLSNSEYLKDNEDFVYFFYIACGITEAIYLLNLNKKVECNIEIIHTSKNIKDSFIDISLEFL